ncbi:MAG: Zn-binding protein [Idiomarina sp.]|uniref:YchJ family protein n=1 Tax=Idiomarina sp. TaxID=1874361 RepID=UPI000C0CB5F5|nr:YchJ family protein [Idiomarina sp.]MAK71971.1 Zn-binding protein [Idiomarinaceae bacterium]MBL4742067.1 YchJ family protein [Idiomarina sp.]MBT41927.1 Zn-binding protein [Idiomarina sp.]PHQ77313.1 MAG: Zn-binding protein [Idiomarina sp.]
MTSNELCPCGSSKGYSTCCQPLHQNIQLAQTPEQLMRSRYSAFVLKLNQYLLKTWHPQTRPKTLNLDDQPHWVKLQILSSEKTANSGKVHFRAFYNEQGEIGFMEELSDFICENGQWFYVSGKVK